MTSLTIPEQTKNIQQAVQQQAKDLPPGVGAKVVNGKTRLVAPPQGNVVLAAKPNTVPVIPSDWAKLGVVTGYNPKSAEDLNLYIVGPSGEGKTTFDSSIPDHLILDFDKAAESIVGSRAMRVPIQNYEHYMEITKKLIDEGKTGKHIVHRVSFDTTDEWLGMIKLRLQTEKGCDDITEFGSQGHGWAMIRERCWSRLRELQEAGFVWSCVGHMITKTETNPSTRKERTVVRDSVFPTFAAQIVNSSDFKLTIYYLATTSKKTIAKKLPTGQVIKQTVESIVPTFYLNSITTEERQGKARGAPGMIRKFEIPHINAWDIFVKNYNTAIEAAKKQNK